MPTVTSESNNIPIPSLKHLAAGLSNGAAAKLVEAMGVATPAATATRKGTPLLDKFVKSFKELETYQSVLGVSHVVAVTQ